MALSDLQGYITACIGLPDNDLTGAVALSEQYQAYGHSSVRRTRQLRVGEVENRYASVVFVRIGTVFVRVGTSGF